MRDSPEFATIGVVAERGTRFEPSVVTFGPTGRVVATAVVLAPLWWAVFVLGVFGVVGAAIYAIWLVPRALRDVWRPAQLPATDLTRLRDASRRAAQVEREHAGRAVPARPAPPTRW